MTSIEIYEPPENQRLWVVRADDGKYFDHFRKSEIIALGHMDAVLKQHYSDDALIDNWNGLHRTLETSLSTNTEISEAKRRSDLSQVENFVEGMSIGDIVLTLQRGSICIGRIIGHPYVDMRPISISYSISLDRERTVTMQFKLRRKVRWGAVIHRRNFPFDLRRALSAHLTVFSIDPYWRELHHLIYPVFKRENTLYFSLGITTEDGINNYRVSSLFSFLSEVEAIVRSSPNLANDRVCRFEQEVAYFRNIEGAHSH